MRRATLLLFVLALTACSPLAAQERPLTSYNLPPNVQVRFTVLVPEDTPAGDIQLSLIDEITGIAFNPQRYTMQPTGDNSYAVTLPLPFGTLVTYRYVHQAEAPVQEASTDLEPLSYRLLSVQSPDAGSSDIVAAWAGSPRDIPTGQISGQITDAASGAPVSGMRVSASGLQTISDSAGFFILNGLLQGQHRLVASSPDGAYRTFQQDALVAEGMDTPAHIQVHAAQMVNVSLILNLPEDSVPSVPIFVVGNLTQLGAAAASPDQLPRLELDAEGRHTLNLLLPAGVDIRYKYTLGDGFWNAEHLPSGGFALRQLFLDSEQDAVVIEDQVSQWTAGDSAPIWFEASPPPDTAGAQLYVQFKLLDWTAPIPMWALGDGRWAYKLYSPTNFGTPIEYRYCLDSACATPEVDAARTVSGNQSSTQVLTDQVNGWQDQ